MHIDLQALKPLLGEEPVSVSQPTSKKLFQLFPVLQFTPKKYLVNTNCSHIDPSARVKRINLVI